MRKALSSFSLSEFKSLSSMNLRNFQTGNFDIFQKLKDPMDTTKSEYDMKRKPTDKVIRLVDEIMSLTLIEAADLCDMCQEKLSERTGQFTHELAPGRAPFPHPSAMFTAPILASNFAPNHTHNQQTTSVNTSGPLPSTPSDNTAVNSTKAEEKKPIKTHATLKLVGFEQSSKVAVVKEVRALTKLGLTESKQLVESFPKIIKKGIELHEAEELKKKLESIGAKIELE